MKEHWEGIAEYADGTRIEKIYPYKANGNTLEEDEEQYMCECDLINAHEGCTFYSVAYVPAEP